jgi:hypothetical protein
MVFYLVCIVDIGGIVQRHCLSALLDLVYGVQRHLQQYFNYVVAASFIGGGKHRPFFDSGYSCKNCSLKYVDKKYKN